MKVGFVQNCPEFGNIQVNLDRIAKMLAGREADLLVLPELFSTGYRFINMDEAHQYAESIPDGLTTNFLNYGFRNKLLKINRLIIENDMQLYDYNWYRPVLVLD